MAENYLDILAETIRNNWNQSALTDFYLTEDGKAQDTSRGNCYTYGEMYAEIVRMADLLTNLGLQKEDHIAICGANSAHWVIAYLAIAKMQGVSVTIMHSLQPDEIARLIDFSDAKAFFVDKELWTELSPFFQEGDRGRLSNVISLEDWNVLCREKQIINHKSKIINGECGFDFVAPNSLAMICFTSGSTGGAKGVMLPYRSLNNNVHQAFLLYPQENNASFLSVLPFSHMAGLIGDMLSQLAFGKNIHILRDWQSLDSIDNALKFIKPYMFVSVPAIFGAKKSNILESLSPQCKLIFMGGAKLGKCIELRIMDSIVPLSIIYGQTETGASISISPYKQHRISSSGNIVEGMTCRIAPNGEILVKGENVMLGYYKDPEATAQKIDKEGWLHTGDKGHLDEDGYLYVEGRLEQDIIVLPNGENIRPDNIESLLNALPEVKESIVIAREGKLVAIVVSDQADLRRSILRTINPQLPLFSQLYDVEITDQPLQRTEKQTIKRYLYK